MQPANIRPFDAIPCSGLNGVATEDEQLRGDRQHLMIARRSCEDHISDKLTQVVRALAWIMHVFISRTARSMPAKTARETMLWPIFSSAIAGDAGDGSDVLVIQPVPGMQRQPGGDGRRAGGRQGRQLARRVGRVGGVGVTPGVQLDGDSAELGATPRPARGRGR